MTRMTEFRRCELGAKIAKYVMYTILIGSAGAISAVIAFSFGPSLQRICEQAIRVLSGS